MGPGDEILLRRWSGQRDAEAFDELVRRYAGMVFGTCRRVLGNEADAEDVAQECFLRLSEVAPSIETSLAGWLHRVATRRCLNLMKRESRRRTRERRYVEEATVETREAWQDLEAHVDAAIEELPDDLRLPLVAHFLKRQTHAAVAEALGVPRRTITHRIGRAVETLRAKLEERGVTVAAASLSSALASHVAEAAPSTLTASLGKLAASGVTGAATAASPASAIGLALKIAAAVMILGLSGALFWKVRSGEAPPPPAATSSPSEASVRSAEPAAIIPMARPDAVYPDVIADIPGLTDILSLSVAAMEPGAIEDPADYCTISGTVVDEEGRGVPMACVRLLVSTHELHDYDAALGADTIQPKRIFTTFADGHGRYVLDGIRYAGTTRLCAFKEGYETQRGARFTITPGGRVTGTDIELPRGRMLRGRVVSLDGGPVSDAVVSILDAWYSQERTYSRGFVMTGRYGHFAFGLDPDTEWCHLRVDSESHGQRYFWKVDAQSTDLRLQMREMGRLHGTITWADGHPAVGLLVRASGPPPEPEMNTWYSGWVPQFRHDALVDDAGHYAIDGLHPGVAYRMMVVKPDAAASRRRAVPLSPAAWNTVPQVFSPGESKERSCTITGSVVIRGHVRTAQSRRPVRQANVWVTKKDLPRPVAVSRSDNEGAYEIRMAAESGTFRIYATSGAAHGLVEEAFSRTFGKDLTLSGTQALTVDLDVFEPVVLPLRVLDYRGEPVEIIAYELNVVAPDGRRTGHGTSMGLDAEGRGTITVYQPAAELSVSVSKWHAGPRMPGIDIGPYVASPGETLPEETIVLPASCGITGIIIDSEGIPFGKLDTRVKAKAKDGREESIAIHTDKHGIFKIEDGVPPGHVTFSQHIEEYGETLTFGPFELFEDTVNDLGEIVIGPAAIPAEE